MTATPQKNVQEQSEQGIRLDLTQLRLFTLQLGVLFSSGVPILQSLDAIALADLPGLSPCALGLRAKLERGWTLSAAMNSFPDAFDQTLVRLVYMGEKTGSLSVTLREGTRRCERLLDSRKKLQQALTYPAVVLVVASSMLCFMAYYMPPRFLPMITSFNVTLPWPTRVLMAINDHRILTLVLALAAAGSLATVILSSHSWARGVRQFLLFKTPLLGPYNYSSMIADLCGDLALMIRSGMTLTSALDLLSKQVRSDELGQALKVTRSRMLNGESFVEALASHPASPALLVSTLEAGQESGKLESLLESLRTLLAEESETLRERMTSLLEPLLVAFMGLVVGFVLLACFLPIYQLISTEL